MKRNRKFLFVAMLAGVFAWGLAACSDDGATGPECGDGTCDEGETIANCPADCDPCNHDGVCDPGESCAVCSLDDGCCTECDLPNMTGADHDFLVSELFLPTDPNEAKNNGVDLNDHVDGLGEIDNKLGNIISMLSGYIDGDINVMVNEEITSGSLLLASRVRESGAGDGIVAVQILQADLVAPDATPIFDGNDTVAIPADTPQDLFLCGEWDGGPSLETSPNDVTIAFPLPEIGMLTITLKFAQIRTVTDPDSPYYDTSAVDANGMTDVMIGGGISKEEIYGDGGLIDFLYDFVANMVAEGGDTADTILGLFDGGCSAQPDIPGCETAAPDTGNCVKDGALHVDELRCNALLSSILAPDVDIDGDGEEDLLSLGLRVAHAVPVTLDFQ